MRIYRFKNAPLALACVVASFIPVLVRAADDLTPALAALRSVGPKNAGTTEAQAALRAVVAAPIDQLPQVFAAIDGANPLAANWIHAAIDTILAREQLSDRRAPTAALVQFIGETQHAPESRRLAFEWLGRFDASAAEQLVPTFLNDPSVELRRDAVARLITAGDSELDAGKKTEAEKTFRMAFNAARDLDQVKELEDRLKKQGNSVDLASHFGFITRWRLIGPFDNTGESAFDQVYPPEKSLDYAVEEPGKSGRIRWIEHTTKDPLGMVDLNEALGKANGVVAYAAAEVDSPRAQDVEIRLGCICANKVWVNGAQVIANNVYHSGEKMDQYIGRARLQAGRNVILVKVLQNEQTESWAQDWHFQLRVCDGAGTAALAASTKP